MQSRHDHSPGPNRHFPRGRSTSPLFATEWRNSRALRKSAGPSPVPEPPDRWLGSSVCRDLRPFSDTIDTPYLSFESWVSPPAAVHIYEADDDAPLPAEGAHQALSRADASRHRYA